MLDKSKLLAQLDTVADQLFVDNSGAYNYAQNAWQTIIADPLFLYKVKAVTNAPWPVPFWKDDLGTICPVSRYTAPHIVVSVDGSQIYPDRHNVASCFLINTGSVVLPYVIENARVQLYSSPVVFTNSDDDKVPLTTDVVNCKRQELELQEGLTLALQVKQEYENNKTVLLFDGSLIFWHLSSKDGAIRDLFLYTYCDLLQKMHHEKIVTAWYISSPKSKELINLVRLYLSGFDPKNSAAYEQINAVIDSSILDNFLLPYTRTIVFQNCSTISHYYPPAVRPFFFYIHTGNEVGRVEIPQWIAEDDLLVDYVAAVVIDQCIKGDGYPVALAEAHEQAVIKGPDRELFYHFLQKMIIERGKFVSISRKSLKKRGIGI